MILRGAGLEDIDFMVDMVENDALAGHYLKHTVPGQARASEIHKFRSAILEGRIQYSFAPEMRARAYILEVGSERAGFTLLREPPFITFVGHADPLVELNMMSITPSLRGQGYGSQFLDLIIDAHKETQPLFGRCLSASQVMISMLRGRRFREVLRHKGVYYFLRSRSLVAQRFAKEIRGMMEP
jgi:GNAT superfamily N-acetyltransferase